MDGACSGQFCRYSDCRSLSAEMVSDSKALIASPTCGYWRLKAGYLPDWDEHTTTLTFHHDAESRAASYASTCYSNSTSMEQCSYFYKKIIAFTEDHETPCSFTS